MLAWIAIFFSRVPSLPRDWTWVSHIAGRFFTYLSHQGSPIKLVMSSSWWEQKLYVWMQADLDSNPCSAIKNSNCRYINLAIPTTMSYPAKWKWKVKWKVSQSCEKSLSSVRLFVTPWTVAHQAPPSMEFPRQEYWSGLSFRSPGDLPDSGIEPRSPALLADTWPPEPPGSIRQKGTRNPLLHLCCAN